MAEISSSSFSEIDANNNQASPNGWPAGLDDISEMNDSSRALAGAVKRTWGRLNGRYASTGSTNAYVLTPDAALGAYVLGERYAFRASFANTGAATLNVSGLGAKSIKKMTPSGKAELAAGDIQNGQPVSVEYDGTDHVIVTPTSSGVTAVGDGLAVSAGVVTLDASFIRGHIAGLALSNNATDATNDIDVAPGVAVDDGNAALMKLSSAITKRLDASWAVGTGQGGLDNGSVDNDWYFAFLIRRPDTGVVDVLFSASATAPVMPANYTQKRRIGAFLRAGGAIVAFTQLGDEFRFKTQRNDVDDDRVNFTSTARLQTLSVPDQIKVFPRFTVFHNSSVADMLITSPDDNDQPVSNTVFTIKRGPSARGIAFSGEIGPSDTSGRLRFRTTSTNPDDTPTTITTVGWRDTRGRFD
jgi:hypothetical protein